MRAWGTEDVDDQPLAILAVVKGAADEVNGAGAIELDGSAAVGEGGDGVASVAVVVVLLLHH